MGTYDALIAIPVQGQPISTSQYGIPVRNAINDLDTRVITLETDTQKLIKRGRRTTAKTPITTESGYARLDDIPVLAGAAYRIMTSMINLDSTVDNEVMTAYCRVLQSASPGTPATTADTAITRMRVFQDANANSNTVPMSAFYFASTAGFLSVLISGQRNTALGTMQFFASAGEPFDLTVEYAGQDPGDEMILL